MNCYTFEASFHGFFNQNRDNFEFSIPYFQELGEHLVNSIYEYMLLIEEEQRIKLIRELEKRKKKHAALQKKASKQIPKDLQKKKSLSMPRETNEQEQEAKPNSGIRDIQTVFKEIDRDEERRCEMEKIEKDETQLNPENGESKEEVNDSDSCSSELNGKVKESLFQEIISSINNFMT